MQLSPTQHSSSSSSSGYQLSSTRIISNLALVQFSLRLVADWLGFWNYLKISQKGFFRCPTLTSLYMRYSILKRM